MVKSYNRLSAKVLISKPKKAPTDKDKVYLSCNVIINTANSIIAKQNLVFADFDWWSINRGDSIKVMIILNNSWLSRCRDCEIRKALVPIKRYLPLILVVVLMATLWWSGWVGKINLENFNAHKDELRSFVDNRGFLSAVVFMAAYIAAVSLSLPIASLLTLVGGFLFGKWLGTILVITSATVGACVIFSITRSSLGSVLRDKAGPLYKKIEENMTQNAFGYLFSIRLIPAFPFFLVNVAAALFNIPLRTFALATFLGIIPGSFVYVNLGQALGEIESLSGLVSGKVLIAFTLLGIFSLLPTFFRQWKKKKEAISLVLVIGMCGLSSPSVAAGSPYESFKSNYGGLLKSYTIKDQVYKGVKYTAVDYDRWQADLRHELAQKALLAVEPETFSSPQEKMAFWINAYNFLTIDLVLRKGERESLRNLSTLFNSAWKKYKWPIAGKEYALDDIEHKILRPMGDARIHFAINCASVSCPDLRDTPYAADQLDRQLTEQTQLALNDPSKGMRIEGNTLYLTKIMDWFARDFANGQQQEWIASYYPETNIQRTKIKFMAYDWSLNKVRKNEQ